MSLFLYMASLCHHIVFSLSPLAAFLNVALGHVRTSGAALSSFPAAGPFIHHPEEV
jgi:hypothetical protein